MTETRPETLATRIGLGSYLLLVLFALLSGALYESADTAFFYQMPLILSCDLGVLAGFTAALAFVRRALTAGRNGAKPNSRTLTRLAPLALLLGCGLCAAVMLRSGMLFDAAPWDTVLGDFLFGAFLALTGWLWWLVLLRTPAHDGALILAVCLGGAVAAFLLVSLLPQGVILLLASLVAPAVTCSCLARLLGNATEIAAESSSADDADTTEGESTSASPATGSVFVAEEASDPDAVRAKAPLPSVLFWAIVLSVFVADLLMSLFPVSLFTEASPMFVLFTGSAEAPALGNLTEPAFIAAVILLGFAVLLALMARRGRVRLPLICSIGFFAVAVGFVTFPYHMPGGAPIGIAQAGEVIIVVFALLALRSFVERASGSLWTLATLRLGVAVAVAMNVADLLVFALYQAPNFDYIDFPTRSVLGGIGVLALVALLVGLMPHVYTAVGGGKAGNAADGKGALTASTSPVPAPSPEEAAEQALHAFAERYRLSPRESEIVGLLSIGRDVPYIEQELVLSKSTVKTHIRHIYEKCGVSSRQDLLDLLHKQD